MSALGRDGNEILQAISDGIPNGAGAVLLEICSAKGLPLPDGMDAATIEAEVCAWLADGGHPDTWHEAESENLVAVFGGWIGTWVVRTNEDGTNALYVAGKFGMTRTMRRAPAVESWLRWVGLLHSSEHVHRLALQRGDNALAERIAQPIKVPGADLLEAWSKRPRDVESVEHPAPLFPALLKLSDKAAARVVANFAAPDREAVPMFPGFGEEAVTPSALLRLFDLGGGSFATKGRGAPVTLRTFFAVCMATPNHQRHGFVQLPAMRFGSFLEWLYPGGMPHYRPARHWPMFRAAFDELESVRVAWEAKDGTGGATRVVSVPTIPRAGRRSDWLRFGLEFPPGSTAGVIMDAGVLRRAGVTSAPAFRLAASLGFAWGKPGTLRTPHGRGGAWLQVRKPDAYPHATTENCVLWTYPSGSTPPNAGRDARRALAFLMKIGYAVTLDPGDGQLRVMPGPKWAGWPD